VVQLKLTFLGTGGSMPTAERGLPSVALRRGGELLLFDCGEGTQRQLVRAGLSPLRVDAVFITHLHGDHFLGLAGLVQTMSLQDRERALEIYCPAGEGRRIRTYLSIPRYTLSFPVDVRELEPGESVRRRGYQIRTAAPDHSVPQLAYALVEDERPGKLDAERARALGVRPGPDMGRLKAGQPVVLPGGRVVRPEEVVGPKRPGRKIVYSGDTRPCDAIVELARGADVLIHECTLDESLRGRADETLHSTPVGAAEIAKRAGVGLLVLVHVSPRYADARALLEQARAVFPNTVVAEDLMELEVPLKP
jgi:ribonuclease Z